jgi:dihydrofolate reductase
MLLVVLVTMSNLLARNVVGTVRDLIRSPGKDIWLVGGSEILSILLNADLINEIILSIHPIILGSGISLFKKIQKLSCLRFVNSKSFESGLVQLHYELRQK